MQNLGGKQSVLWSIGKQRIENMHNASAKLKLNKLVGNVGVVEKLRQRRFEREILSTVLFRNAIYQTHPSNQTSRLKLKKK